MRPITFRALPGNEAQLARLRAEWNANPPDDYVGDPPDETLIGYALGLAMAWLDHIAELDAECERLRAGAPEGVGDVGDVYAAASGVKRARS